GLLLPTLALALDAWGMVLLDAQIPPAEGPTPPAGGWFADFVTQLPVEQGRLPKWSQWWGPGGLDALFPDHWTRDAFEADLPRLRPEWFADEITTPPWDHLRVGYIQTSSRFAEQAEDAKARGWPTTVLTGTHLHPFLAGPETALAISETLTALAG
ncbi:MAG TPA: hypothetical protein VIO94_17600, partial [Phenylobacterium sp.]